MKKFTIFICLTLLLASCNETTARSAKPQQIPEPRQSPSPTPKASPTPTPSPSPKEAEHKSTAPVLLEKTKCKFSFPTDTQKNQVYISQDCKTAFIVPISSAKLDIVLLGGSDDSVCDDIKEEVNRSKKDTKYYTEYYTKKLEELEAELTHALEDKKEDIKELIEQYRIELRQVVERHENKYHRTAAMLVRFIVCNAKTINLNVEPYSAANPHLTIAALQMDSSVMELAHKSLIDDHTPVIRVQIPTLGHESYPPFGATNPRATYAFLNGALSGTALISSMAFCTDKASKSQELIAAKYLSIKILTSAHAKYETGESFRIEITEQLN
ncbi:hypothetical protein ACLSU7_06535 [Bdellovibrio sp. HCB185ZH]|uniref:hypothetical protein n=1 Tax=Bdellovibrio sp. HCB185ZH TaxID=3394235 RepID=UPI0039A73472